MKTTSPDPENNSSQDMETNEQLPDDTGKLLFLMDRSEEFTGEENIGIQ